MKAIDAPGPQGGGDAAPDAPREIELKLFVPPSGVDRIWSHPLIVAHALGPLKIARLESRYFDTPTRELAQRRMALRLRRSGRNWLQTLKTAGERDGAVSARGEWEMAVAGPALELAKLRDTPLATIGAARALAKRLQPVFVTDFRRESRRLRLPDGSEVEFAFDRGTIAVGRGRTRRSIPICEVEIEVKQGGRDDAMRALMRFAARLARDVALIPLAASKAERGYRLADGVPSEPAKPTLPPSSGSDDAGRHLGRVLDACHRALLDNVHSLFDQPEGVDGSFDYVHQARVALRRMRSAIRTFRSVASGRRVTALDGALRVVSHAFGAARDWDVLATTSMEKIDEVVGVDAAGSAALADLRTAIAARRADAHLALRRLLDGGPFGATAIDVERVVARLASGKPSTTLDDCAARWLGKQRTRVVRRSRRIAVLDEKARHGLRIEVKRLRYALDLLQTLYDDDAVAAFRDALTDLQGRLGRLNDQAVTLALLRSLEPAPARDLVVARYAAWFDRHVNRQLPKIAAESVTLELTPPPWAGERRRADVATP